jgi:uncharacterized protein (TIGR03435 family)
MDVELQEQKESILLRRLLLPLLLVPAFCFASGQFDVASVKVTKESPSPAAPIVVSPERGVFSCNSCSVVELISLAFGGTLTPNDIVFENGTSKAAWDTIVAVSAKGTPCSKEVLVERLKTLLVDRFGFQYTAQSKEFPVYEMTAPKYKANDEYVVPDEVDGPVSAVLSIPVEALAVLASVRMNAIVVDKTGLPLTDRVKLMTEPGASFQRSLQERGFAFEKVGTGTRVVKVVVTSLRSIPTED